VPCHAPFGTKTPKTSQGNFKFVNVKVEESAPTTKVNSNCGNLSERLHYNRDPLSFNCNKISIDDEGNINVNSSPSPSPIRPVPTTQMHDEEIEEAKTFHSSHLLFSHLMSFDAKKNTLEQLNS